MANNIQDFGEKIGGARKDYFKTKNLDLTDLDNLTEIEKDQFVKKSNIWKKPDYQALYDSGVSREAVYYIKHLYESIPAKTPSGVQHKNYINFVSIIRDSLDSVRTRDGIDESKRIMLESFSTQNGYHLYPKEGFGGLFNNKILKVICMDWNTIEEKIVHEQFLYTDREKALSGCDILQFDPFRCSVSFGDKPRVAYKYGPYSYSYFYATPSIDLSKIQSGKYIASYLSKIEGINFDTKEQAENFIIEQRQKQIDDLSQSISEKLSPVLDEIMDSVRKKIENEAETESNRKRFYSTSITTDPIRKGPVERDADAAGENYMERFGFRGGEFGNWMDDGERQAALNGGYDALCDLAKVLGISDKSVSFNGRLAIAFGARGRGGSLAAAAHYEPGREVINLTKFKGAGTLGHEWAHALDDAIGKSLGFKSFLSGEDIYTIKKSAPAFAKMIETMCYKDELLDADDEFRKEYDLMKVKADNFIKQLIPDSQCSADQIKRREQLTEDILKNHEESQGALNPRTGRYDTTPSVQKLSDLRKEITGHVIPAKYISPLVQMQQHIDFRCRYPKDVQKVETDYYKASKAMDEKYAKSGHGYWASPVEMFARAFAVYLYDNTPYRSDYLNAAADTGDRSYPIPRGEERKAISACIKDVLDEVKSLGVLTPSESKSISLDDLIKSAAKSDNAPEKSVDRIKTEWDR